MIPNFTIFGKVFSPYMILALIGALTILLVTYKMAKHNHLDEFHMLYMMLFSFIGVAVGGSMMYGITNTDKLLYLLSHFHEISSFGEFIKNLQVIFGGSVFYGGLFGAFFVSYIYMKKKKLDMSAYTDIGALAIPLFHTLGRIGCFLSGCCYGIPCSFGITYHYSLIPSANGVVRFPIQLVEASFNLILFLTLFCLYKKQRFQGRLLALYLVIYPIGRFILEFFRGDDYRGHIGILSTSQIISIAILLAISAYFIKTKISSKSTNQSQ